MRSLTELYIVSRAPDKIAAVVMSTTGATIAWIAVTAIGFIGPAYESSAGQNLPGPAGTRTYEHTSEYRWRFRGGDAAFPPRRGDRGLHAAILMITRH